MSERFVQSCSWNVPTQNMTGRTSKDYIFIYKYKKSISWACFWKESDVGLVFGAELIVIVIVRAELPQHWEGGWFALVHDQVKVGIHITLRAENSK